MDTKSLTLPSGKVATIREWLTARESRELRGILVSNTKFTADASGKVDIQSVSPSAINEEEDAALRLVVVALDASNENILDRVLDLPQNDFDTLIKAVREVTSGVAGKKK